MAAKVFIWGSCVSRDSFEYFGKRYELLGYVARQSMISSGNVVELDTLPQLTSPFQQRMNAGDAAGNAVELIASVARQTSLLLLDLCDERLGVIDVGDGRYLTRTVERIRTGADEKLLAEYRRIKFGSPQHLQLWTSAFTRVVDQLVKLRLTRRTLVLAPPWATETVQGSPTPASFGLKAPRANELFALYYDVIRRAGIRVVGTDLPVLSDDHHKWGPAPFHYDLTTYEAILTSVRRSKQVSPNSTTSPKA